MQDPPVRWHETGKQQTRRRPTEAYKRECARAGNHLAGGLRTCQGGTNPLGGTGVETHSLVIGRRPGPPHPSKTKGPAPSRALEPNRCRSRSVPGEAQAELEHVLLYARNGG